MSITVLYLLKNFYISQNEFLATPLRETKKRRINLKFVHDRQTYRRTNRQSQRQKIIDSYSLGVEINNCRVTVQILRAYLRHDMLWLLSRHSAELCVE